MDGLVQIPLVSLAEKQLTTILMLTMILLFGGLICFWFLFKAVDWFEKI